MRRHVSTLLDGYLDGVLTPRDTKRVEDHVLTCDPCRTELAELRRTVELLHGMRGGVDAPDVSWEVIARIRRGEADVSVWERWRARVAGLFASPLGAPLATASAGLLLLAVLPRIEIEILLPGDLASKAPQAEMATATPPAPSPRVAAASLLARRVSDSMSAEPSARLRSPSFACLASSQPEFCHDQHALMTRLARDDVWAFLAEIEQVPEPRRDLWLHALSRYAADSGDAADVAARLRATGDPRAQRLAVRFEEAH
jgi:hypothetical protein